MSEANQNDSTFDMFLKVLMNKMSRIESEMRNIREENRRFTRQFFQDIRPLTDFIRSRQNDHSFPAKKESAKAIALRLLAKFDCQDKIDYLEESDESINSSKQAETDCEIKSDDLPIAFGEVDDASTYTCDLNNIKSDISDYSGITSSRTPSSSLMFLQSNSDSDVWWSAKSSLEDLTAIDCQLSSEDAQMETTITPILDNSRREDPQQTDVKENVLKELDESNWDEDAFLSRVTFVELKNEVNEETLFEAKCLLWRFDSFQDIRNYGVCNLKLLKHNQTKRLRCLAFNQEATVEDESILNFAVGHGFKFRRGKRNVNVLAWTCMDFSSLSLSKGEQLTFICQFENQTQLINFEKIAIQFIDKVN
ncbi:hypothetical protein M3Y98_00114200 [Aphelenchoides besseyi]|nr:hypothetical protein M3Y98_00114200 [Aphelenchoides besseyi]